MSNRSLSKLVMPLTLVAAAVALVAFTAFGVARPQKSPEGGQGKAAYEERRALVETLRREGLKGAAKVKGNFVRTFDPHPDWLSLDLEQLTQNSEAVIVGIPTKNR